MVFVTYPHSAKQLRVKDSNATVLHTTKRGSYVFTPVTQESRDQSFSRYCGLHIPFQTSTGWNLYKIIHSFLPNQKPTTVSMLSNGAKFEYGQAHLQFSLSDENVLTLETKGDLEIPLVLDCREIYKFDTTGRNYTVTQEYNRTIIRYQKKQNDDSNSSVEKLTETKQNAECYIVVETHASIKKDRDWFKTNYALEEKRNAGETSGYVFHPFTIHARGEMSIRIASGFTKTECLIALATESPIEKVAETQSHHPIVDIALAQAKNAFSQLYITSQGDKPVSGLYAGVPWFFQFWSRDEAISCIGLLKLGKYTECKEILLRELSTVSKTGQIVNRYPHSELPSADGTGWMAKRFLDLLRVAPHIFTRTELQKVYTQICSAITLQEKHHLKNGFIYSKPLETWMDTGRGYDERAGNRIEIQVLHLVQLQLRKTLSFILEDSKFAYFESAEETFAQNIRASFLQDDILCDGIIESGDRDATIRPNIFLSHYLYPNLLTKDQWETVFDRALDALYQSWGGLSTIDKSHPFYRSEHTGQTNESYHRGDSWYWVNNLAAICLTKVNSAKYKKTINQITSASVEEILQHGALGCHAEISDSVALSSLGCYNQLWSNALFIELVDK